MKHFITTALLAMSCAGVQAQSLTNIETNDYNSVQPEELYIIPQELSYNKQTSIYAVRRERVNDNYGFFFDVYDDSFNKLKTISPLINQLSVKIITKRRGENGEWKENTEEYSGSYSNFEKVKYNTAQGTVDVYLTQTFFNDDEKYEHLAYNIIVETQTTEEFDRDGDGEIDEIVIQEGYAVKGLKIMNEDGETLSSINFDENFYHEGGSIGIMLVNGKKYISVPGFIYPDGNRNYESRVPVRAIYSVDSSNSGIRKVMTTKGLRVSPTIADRSQTITVELEGDSGKSHEVRVVNAAGQTVKQAVIPAGQRSIKLNAAELGQGMNIVNVNGKQGGNCKIIIK